MTQTVHQIMIFSGVNQQRLFSHFNSSIRGVNLMFFQFLTNSLHIDPCPNIVHGQFITTVYIVDCKDPVNFIRKEDMNEENLRRYRKLGYDWFIPEYTIV